MLGTSDERSAQRILRLFWVLSLLIDLEPKKMVANNPGWPLLCLLRLVCSDSPSVHILHIRTPIMTVASRSITTIVPACSYFDQHDQAQ